MNENDRPDPETAAATSQSEPDCAATPPKTEPTWRKAIAALNDVSCKTSKAGGAIASRAVEVSASGAIIGAEIGRYTVGTAADAARDLLDAGKQAYVGSRLESAVAYVDRELDERGAKQALRDGAGAVVDKLDQVTGKRLIELLEERLRLQDGYNDILATRLAEALERITALESRIGPPAASEQASTGMSDSATPLLPRETL